MFISFASKPSGGLAFIGSVLMLCALPIRAERPPAAPKGESTVTLDAGVTVVEDSSLPGPVLLAERDLESDLTKVFGHAPHVVSSLNEGGPLTIVVGQGNKLPGDLQTTVSTAPESFSISILPRRAGHGGNVIRLTGADMRGTIYAIYEFSQKYLGVDPMYYWTDNEPARRSSITLPASLNTPYPAPVTRYRGFFINDEDMLTGWAPGEAKDKTGISLAAWNKIDETILRLKGNIVVPGTWIFPDDPQVKFAATRGLILNQHHAIPLGVNVARWPKDVPYNFTTHPEILERAWKDAVAQYQPGQEILWSVGLRGLSDSSYASLDPSVRNNDKALGALISKAIAEQISIVRAVHPDAKFVTDLWQEGARLVREGYLTIPPEVIPVWADIGYGYLQDDGQVKSGEGAYYHVAMMNNRANQLTEMVPVSRMYAELGRYQKAHATEYMLVNTSDIRPVTMTTRAIMDAAWKGVPAGEASAAPQFYRNWAKEEFGERAAVDVAAIYQEYFDAQPHMGTPPREYGDQLYHTEARQMMLSALIDNPMISLGGQSPKWQPPRLMDERFTQAMLTQIVPREIATCGDAQARWDAVWARAQQAEALVDPDRRPFYEAAVLTMIEINRESNTMLLNTAKAVQELATNNKAGAAEHVDAAIKATNAILAMEKKAEYGKWTHWYRGDWLDGVPRTLDTLEFFRAYLDDPLTHMLPPILWNNWEAYYHIMHYEGDRSVDVQ